MENNPTVVVGPPDGLGLRKVTVDGKTAGKVRSPRELRKLLSRAGLPFERNIQWRGGDSTVWPNRSWLRLLHGSAAALCLLTTAIVLFKIGMADFFSALTYAGRIAGATFLVAAAIEVIGIAAVFDYWTKRRVRFSGAVVFFAAAISLLANASLLLVQMGGRVYTRYLWLWIVLIVWSSWALFMLVRSQAWAGLQNPKRIAIGAVVSTVLAVTSLTYSQFYVPYTASPLVETAAEFRSPTLNKDGTVMYLPVHLSVKNAGRVAVYVLGSIYWIHGKPVGTPDYTLIQPGEFIAPPGRALNPGEEFSGDEVVKIDNPRKSDFETVRAQTEMYVIRADRMTITADYENSKKYAGQLAKEGKDKDPEGPPGDYFRYQAEISNSNEILNVTRGHQRVTVWWMYRGSWPYIYVDVAPPGERKAFDPRHPDANKEVIDRYGLARVRGSMVQTPFLQLLDKAEAEHSAH